MYATRHNSLLRPPKIVGSATLHRSLGISLL